MIPSKARFHPLLALPVLCFSFLTAIAVYRIAEAQDGSADAPPSASQNDLETPPEGSQTAKTDAPPTDATAQDDGGTEDPDAGDTGVGARQSILASLTIFVLSVFVGFEVITKVPPMLHTPLMSGSNAISGITLVGALLVAGTGLGAAPFLGFLAVLLATINVVGGFLVTHRMLSMFKKR